MMWRGFVVNITIAVTMLAIAPAAWTLQEETDVVLSTGTAGPSNGLNAPPDMSVISLLGARGNVLRWRDAYRAMHGDASGSCPSTDACLPTIDGYFIVFAPVSGPGEFSAGSIVRIVLRDDFSRAGAAMVGNATLIAGGSGVCGVTVAGVDMADVAYLGREMNPNWVTQTRAAFAGAAPVVADEHARTLTGRMYRFTQRPDPGHVYAYQPHRLSDRGLNFSADAICGVSSDGSMACGARNVVPEPLEWGVVAWASRIGEEYHVAPELADGSPSAGTCLSVHFGSG